MAVTWHEIHKTGTSTVDPPPFPSGIVKYALLHGYRLTPVYTFGEESTYSTMNSFQSFRLWLNKFGIPGVVFMGWPLFPLMPKRGLEIHTVVGDPLQLPKIEKPTKEDVQEWHGKYIQALQELFDKNKAKFGQKDAQLIIS